MGALLGERGSTSPLRPQAKGSTASCWGWRLEGGPFWEGLDTGWHVAPMRHLQSLRGDMTASVLALLGWSSPG